MTDAYCDTECCYLGGDPRLDDRGTAEIELLPDSIRIEVKTGRGTETIHVAKGAIECVYYDEQRLGIDQTEFDQGIVVDPNELLMRHTAVVVTNDPEGVLPAGIRVRVGFRNEYFAKVFEKRCAATYGTSNIPF